MKKKTIKKMSKQEFLEMLRSWLEGDLVKAEWPWNYIEKRNEAFLRGWRQGIYSVIRKLEENL